MLGKKELEEKTAKEVPFSKGPYSSSYILPHLPLDNYADLIPRITLVILNNILDDKYDNQCPTIALIDCCFDEEYNSGYISQAINIKTEKALNQWLFQRSSCGPLLLILYYEFSIYRGLYIAQYIRKKD